MSATLFIAGFVLFFALLPAALQRLSRLAKIERWLSDIVLCYLMGMLLGNTRAYWLLPLWTGASADMPSWNGLAEGLATGGILLSLPMLLFTNDIRKGLSYTGKMSSLFFFGVLSAVLAALVLGYVYQGQDLPHLNTAAGMLTGVYTGGTPNMVAVNKALDAPESLFILLNVTDVVVSGLYFLFLLTFGRPLLAWFLPAFKGDRGASIETVPVEKAAPLQRMQKIRALAKGMGLTLLIVGASVAVAALFPNEKGEPNQASLWLVLTTAAIALSFRKSIRELPAVPDLAHYLLLVFGLSAGFLANLSDLADTGWVYLQFNLFFLLLVLLLYGLFGKLLRSDRETWMLCTVATIMGPPFVAQLAAHLKNKALLPIAVALSLVGLGLGNYTGLLVVYLLEWLF